MLKHKRQGRLAAGAQTPWIGVHVLTEFMYCPRAGLIAHEDSEKQPPMDTWLGKLNYLPRWSLAEINRRLRISIQKATAQLVLLGVLVGMLLLRPEFFPFSRSIFVLTAVAVAFCGWMFLRSFRDIWILLSRRLLATSTSPREPNTDLHQPQPVSWWSLANAGFESVKYPDNLCDERLRLSGRPWRVLRKGSLRIPVFLMRGNGRLRKQHFARVAAYCHLLATCEGAQSPYGVVIYAGTYEGLAVPNSPSARKAFHDGLVRARCILAQVAKGHEPYAPSSGAACLECPLGKPFVHRKRWFVRSRVHSKRGADSRLYHSQCGDRFRWVPRHEKAIRKRLT